jgi:hypothetical protein
MAVVGKTLRRIGDPVVAAAPAGVRVRTWLHLSEREAAALGWSVNTWVRCIERSWRAESGWGDWTAGNTAPGGRSVSGR